MGQQISSPDCYPVTVPANDDFYRKYNLTCLNFVRTYPTVPAGCGFGAIALASGPSAYIDLSIIYGTTKELSDQLRTMKGGELKTNAQNVMYEDPNCPAGQHACYIIGNFLNFEFSTIEWTVCSWMWWIFRWFESQPDADACSTALFDAALPQSSCSWIGQSEPDLVGWKVIHRSQTSQHSHTSAYCVRGLFTFIDG